jgi:hypothetical protein
VQLPLLCNKPANPGDVKEELFYCAHRWHVADLQGWGHRMGKTACDGKRHEQWGRTCVREALIIRGLELPGGFLILA